MIRVQVKTDTRPVGQVEQRVFKNADKTTREAVEALRDDIRSSWSLISPSKPGQPPAVDTGNLSSETAITVAPYGRGAGGRFAREEDAVAHTLRIDTTQGSHYHGRGAYEQYLEEGTDAMKARPFVDPAVKRLRGTFRHFFTDIFK